MKRKYIWLGFLVIILGFSYVFFKYSENTEIGGIRIVSTQKLNELTQGLSYMGKTPNAGELIKLQGQNPAFDSDGQVYYISQTVGSEDFEAVFQTDRDFRYYIEDDGFGDLDDAMYEGRPLRVWITDFDTYTICNMIFTGAPTIALYTDDIMSAEYGKGEITLFDPEDEDVHGLSVKNSNALIKHNPNSETYSVKLMSRSYDDEKKLSFLGTGSNNNWKLYKVSENDGTLMKALLASDVWNMINKDTNRIRIYRLVELVVNDSYKGVYLMAPKWTAPYLGLDSGWELARSEDMGEKEKNELYNSIDPDSMSRYALFLQISYAYANVADDYIIVYNGLGNNIRESMIVPDKIEYAFGGFNNRLNYMSLGEVSGISGLLFEPENMGLERGYYEEEIFPACSRLWEELREDEFADDNVLRMINEYRDFIIDGGLHARCVKGNKFGYHYERLEEYIVRRMKCLDEYYMFSGEGNND